MIKKELQLIMQDALKLQKEYAKLWEYKKEISLKNGYNNCEANSIAYGSLRELDQKRHEKSYEAMGMLQNILNVITKLG